MADQTDARRFIPLNIAVLTVSDTRRPEDDRSGDTLTQRLTEAGHSLAARSIVPDEIPAIRERVEAWLRDPGVEIEVAGERDGDRLDPVQTGEERYHGKRRRREGDSVTRRPEGAHGGIEHIVGAAAGDHAHASHCVEPEVVQQQRRQRFRAG